MLYQCARVIGNKIICPLYRKNDLSFPLKEILNLIDGQVKLVVVCNPNNPTGTAVSIADIEKIAQKSNNAIVYVDEAYFEFSKNTAIPLIQKHSNIIITRTFSKAFGLASLRIGYVIATTEYITELLKVRGPYDVNMPAYYAACAVLEDRQNMEHYSNEVMKKAKPLVEKFFSENNVPFYLSNANFILFQPDNPEKVMKALIRAGVLVRPQNKQNIENTLRVTIGTTEQMKKFIEIYKSVVLRNAKPITLRRRKAGTALPLHYENKNCNNQA
jgi:histidinol-phosphate aminotransferase